MRLSEYIELLQSSFEEFGDMNVISSEKGDEFGDLDDASPPIIKKYRKSWEFGFYYEEDGGIYCLRLN